MIIQKASPRKLPRGFELPWGKGIITEEAAIKCTLSDQGLEESWEPTVQLLEFQNGERALRFCVYSSGRLRRIPLILDEEQAAELASVINLNPVLKSVLGTLLR